MADQLNLEQLAAYDAIIHSNLSHPSQDESFLIDGPGGTGKSFLYKCITKRLHFMGLNVCSCQGASTGIAATLLDGCTVHKRFGVPMLLEFDSISILNTTSRLVKFTWALIWDLIIPFSPFPFRSSINKKIPMN